MDRPRADAKTIPRLLFLGFGEGDRYALPDDLSDYFKVRFAYMSDQLSRHHLEDSDAIILNVDAKTGLAARVAGIQTSSSVPLPLITYGKSDAASAISNDLKSIGHIRPPLITTYLIGLVDALVYDRSHIRSIDGQRERVRRLWELSSALLRVTRRDQLGQVLGSVLPELMNASLLAICLPELEKPLVHWWTRPGMGRDVLEVFQSHLEESWRGVRPDTRVDFHWVDRLDVSDTRTPTPGVSKNSFITAPITLQGHPVGFFCVLARHRPRPSEIWLKTFFVVSDLINVLLQNLELRDQLAYRATHDGLTTLLNRQSILEELEKECRRARRYHGPVTVVMIDLDHFKKINDTMGHLVGDEVLRQATARLRESLREFDIAGRTGGEEFLVLLPHTESEGGTAWARRFQEALCQSPIYAKKHTVELTASCGVASGRGDECHVDRLIGMADSALYEAKRNGRNRITVAEERHIPEVVIPSDLDDDFDSNADTV